MLNWMIISFLGMGLLFAGCAGTGKSNPSAMQTNSVEYSIDGKPVSGERFQSVYSGLKQVGGTWFCAETRNGGITGYDMKDSSGRVYEFRAISESGKNKSTLNGKMK